MSRRVIVVAALVWAVLQGATPLEARRGIGTFGARSDSTGLQWVDIDGDCIEDPFGQRDMIAVESDSLYGLWAAGIKEYPQCRDYQLPEIDFSRYRLVGMQIFADCRARFDLRLWSDLREQVQHLLVMEEYGGCRGMRLHELWVLVPQLPADYRLRATEVVGQGDFNGDDELDVLFWDEDDELQVIYDWTGQAERLGLPDGLALDHLSVDDHNADGYSDLIVDWGEQILYGSSKGLKVSD